MQQEAGAFAARMQDLITSMERFSTALTLFGLEQLEHTMSAIEGPATLWMSIDRLEDALNALSDVLTAMIDGEKKETLNSVTNTSRDLVNRALDGARMLDPRDVLRTGNDMLQKTTGATSEWISKAASAVENARRTAEGGSTAGGSPAQTAGESGVGNCVPESGGFPYQPIPPAGSASAAEAITLVSSTPVCVPHLSCLIVSESLSGTTLTVNLRFTYSGYGDVRNVLIKQVALRTLGGSGKLNLINPALPVVIGNLAAGSSTTFTFTLNMPSTVTKFSMSESGTVQDTGGNTYNYYLEQVLFP